MKKVISGIMLTLLLIGMLTLTFNIQPVKTSGTIYIRADGSIDPRTAPITTVDNLTYIFVGNIYDEIVVERSNTIVDGNGYILQGTEAVDSKGVSLWSIQNVSIQHINIKKFHFGVYFCSSLYSIVSENNLEDNGNGIYLDFSNNNTVSGNNVDKSGNVGVFLWDSNGNLVYENNITRQISHCGLLLYYSSFNTIFANSIRYSQYGIYLDNESYNNTISENNITNSNQNGLYYCDSYFNTFSENNITNNTIGVFVSSDSNTVFGNNVADNGVGVMLRRPHNNRIFHNSFINNSQQIGFEDFTYTNVWDDGYPSGGNYWSDYTGADTHSGPYQNETGSDAIGDMSYIIDANNQDRYPLMGPFETVTKTGENVTVFPLKDLGIIFENVTAQGLTTVNKSQTGPDPPSGFKLSTELYYDIQSTANYTGKIEMRIAYDDSSLTQEEESNLQFLQWNETLLQWIDITTCLDTENNLIYGETNHLSTFAIITILVHNIAVTRVASSKSVVGQGHPLSIYVTVKNWDYAESVNVTAYCNESSIILPDGKNYTTVTLTIRNWAALVFACNTTDFAKGNYIISAYALSVQRETYTADNILTHGWITITISGDVNGDFKVDGKDVAAVAKAYNTSPGQPFWNPNADINGDNKVDGKDIAIVAKNYGKHDP